MVAKDLEVGDLVWAKMKGFPMWPGRISQPNDKVKPPSLKKPQHFVYFFGTHNFAWILDELICRHSLSMVESAKGYKKKPASLMAAIKEIQSEEEVEADKEAVADNEQDNSNEVEDGSDERDASPLPPTPPPAPSPPPKKQKVIRKAKVPVPKKKTVPQKRRRESSDAPAESNSGSENEGAVVKRNLGTPFYSAALERIDRDESPAPEENGLPRTQVVMSYADQGGAHSTRILDRHVYPCPPLPPLDVEKVSEKLLAKRIKPSTKKIGFLGLGMMGRGMVKNLLNSGHDVTLWNRTAEKCAPFVACGASQADTPSDVVSQCDITFCCVSDSTVAKELVFGNCGVLRGLNDADGATAKGYVEMSSIDPATSQEIAEAVSDKGGRYLEAPVLGSRELAERGELLVLGAGDQSLFKDCEPCFFALSAMSYWLGCEVGAGIRMNIAMGMLQGTAMAGLAEALALVEAGNDSTENFITILRQGPFGHSFFIDNLRSMVRNEYTPNTALKHQQKDLNLAVDLGSTLKQPLTVSGMANELFKRAKLMRYADHDMSAVRMGTKL